MTSTTVTKATLSSDLEAAEARIAELELRLAERDRIELSTTLWVNDRITNDRTKSGSPLVKFSAQKSVKTQDGGRVYGQYHNFVCYGETADLFSELNAAGEKLLRITAFESPWSNGARKSDWVVTSLAPFERPEQAPSDEAATAPAAPFSGEPTDEGVPF